MSWLKKRLPKKRWKRVCLYLLSLFVMLVAADMVLVQCWRHIDISSETTRITSPLKANGLPDYVAARNAACSQGVTAENNAAPDLFRIVGTDRFPQWWREKILPQLGMPPEEFPSLFTPYEIWLEKRKPLHSTREEGQPKITPAEQARDEDIDSITRKPWKSAAYPDRVQWLKEQQISIDGLHLALSKDRFYVPWDSIAPVSVFESLSPWWGESRGCNDVLIADAMRAAGDTEEETFQRDVLDASKLARLVMQGTTLMECLVGCAIESNVSTAVERGAAMPFLSAGSARKLLQAWTSMPAFPDESRPMDKGERFFSLGTFCAASQIGLQAAVENQPQTRMGVLFVPIHYNAVLRTFNHYFDELIAADQLPTYRQRTGAMKAVETEAASHHNFLDIGENLVKVIAPSFGRTVSVQETSFVHHDLATVALALRVYQDEHGAFPASLAELSPGIVPALPPDGFAEAPFHYQRAGKGYVLYSVGPDGKDDGGRDRKSAAKGEGWDIVVRAAE
jgi:hypothetical protein